MLVALMIVVLVAVLVHRAANDDTDYEPYPGSCNGPSYKDAVTGECVNPITGERSPANP
jgi:hypothetical protein